MKVRQSVDQLLPLLVRSSRSGSNGSKGARRVGGKDVQSFEGVRYWPLGVDMAVLPERYSNNLTRHHALVFLLTFFSYVFVHAARKTFSNVRTALAETWTLLPLNETIFFNTTQPPGVHEEPFLETVDDAEMLFGILDTVFLVSYGIGLFICGFIGDRLDLRLVLSFGMCMSALMMFLFGTVSEWVKIYNHWYYIVFWILNGFLQGTGWPMLIAVMGNWFSEDSRGLVFGIWSSCGSLGNILGAFCASLVLTYGYEFAFLVTAMMMFFWGVIVFIFLVPSPRDATTNGDSVEKEDESKSAKDPKERKSREKHFTDSDTDMTDQSSDEEEEDITKETSSKPEAIGFFQAFLLPGVPFYSLGFACLKLVHYALFSWLPYYLTSRFAWQEVQADQVSMAYDFGGIIGGMIGGVISDFMGIRSPVVVAMLFGSMASLYGYSATPGTYAVNAVVMATAGAFVCGVTHLVASAVAADLGQQRSSQDKVALATVTGIVDGTGTLGAAIGQVVVPILNIYHEWNSVFAFLVLMIAMSIVLISPIFIKEVRSKCSFNSENEDGDIQQKTMKKRHF